MDYRRFILNNEYCMIHYPHRPNGFGVLIIGNQNQYVDRTGSFWQRNFHRNKILTYLLGHGYTVYYSNLGGQHMGNSQAVEQAKDLYEFVKRTEILNGRIHIIAEDLGAMVAHDFLKLKQEVVRSVLFLNPVFSLEWMRELVDEQPFIYHRFLHNVSQAYNIPVEQCETLIQSKGNGLIFNEVPFKIIHILNHGMNDDKWIKMYKKYFSGMLDRLHLVLHEKYDDISYLTYRLFKENEHLL